MKYKKILFPIGAGDDIEPRIYGALRVAKWLGTHIEVLACQMDPSVVYNMKMTLRGGVLYEEFLKAAKAELGVEHEENEAIFKRICNELDIKISQNILEGEASAKFITRQGRRSTIVEQESKFCDMVVAAVPLNGKITGTFEAAVMKSGKNVIAIPRNLKSFSAKNILVSWTGTAQSSRALTSSLELLKGADEVHCITSRASLGDDVELNLRLLEEYFGIHGIKASFEVVDTTSMIPGEALLKAAKNKKADLIVAGRHGDNGLREMFLGGTSKFFLEHTDIPVFM